MTLGGNMKQIAINFIKNAWLGLLKQKWFQKELVKQITKYLNRVDETESLADDAFVQFIRDNKDEILPVLRAAAENSDSAIDEILIKTVEKC